MWWLTPRDLRLDPPVHVAVLRLTPTWHALVIVLDHAVSDGGTLTLFARQLGRHYRARMGQADRPRPMSSFWT